MVGGLDLQSQSVKCRPAGLRKRTADFGLSATSVGTDLVRNSGSTAGFTRHVVPALPALAGGLPGHVRAVSLVKATSGATPSLSKCKLQATSKAREATQGQWSSTVPEFTQASWNRVEDEAPSWCEMPPTATGLELNPGLPGRSGASPKTNAPGPQGPSSQ
jgi:hypothetical protein